MQLDDAAIASYHASGFLLLRGWIDPAALDLVEADFLARAAAISCPHKSMHTRQMASWLADNRRSEQFLYDAMRASPAVREFAASPDLTLPVGRLLGRARWRLTDHCRFRIDQPHQTRELATWHQDLYYTQTDPDAITAWVPLQHTFWDIGPLLVIPGSHKAGLLDHTITHGKRRSPGILFDTLDLRMIEMRRGDLLLFHSLLLHSGQVNLTDRVRFSVQARYAPL